MLAKYLSGYYLIQCYRYCIFLVDWKINYTKLQKCIVIEQVTSTQNSIFSKRLAHT